MNTHDLINKYKLKKDIILLMNKNKDIDFSYYDLEDYITVDELADYYINGSVDKYIELIKFKNRVNNILDNNITINNVEYRDDDLFIRFNVDNKLKNIIYKVKDNNIKIVNSYYINSYERDGYNILNQFYDKDNKLDNRISSLLKNEIIYIYNYLSHEDNKNYSVKSSDGKFIVYNKNNGIRIVSNEFKNYSMSKYYNKDINDVEYNYSDIINDKDKKLWNDLIKFVLINKKDIDKDVVQDIGKIRNNGGVGYLKTKVMSKIYFQEGYTK